MIDAATTDVLVIAAYLSLLLELWLLPVPSVASARSLARSASKASSAVTVSSKVLLLYGPVAVNILVFLLPLLGAISSLMAEPSAQAASTVGILAPAGIVAVLFGRTLTILSALALRSRVQLTLAAGTLDPPLHSSGVFRFSRNPGLLGMYLFAIGLLALRPCFWFALGLCHYVWHMHRRVLIEEEHLVSTFGAAYKDYMVRTRRYV